MQATLLPRSKLAIALLPPEARATGWPGDVVQVAFCATISVPINTRAIDARIPTCAASLALFLFALRHCPGAF
jgi:hypothetical protein